MMPMDILYRSMASDDTDRVVEIDRSEVIEGVWYLREGRLVLERERWEGRGWPPGKLPYNIARIRDCLDRGGAAWGAFEGERLVGIAVLDGRTIGTAGDTLDLYFLHVSSGHRGQGIGGRLLELAKGRAREMGARRMYVSATPSERTVAFYRRTGFDLAREVDPELYELEPEDIHMDLDL